MTTSYICHSSGSTQFCCCWFYVFIYSLRIHAVYFPCSFPSSILQTPLFWRQRLTEPGSLSSIQPGQLASEPRDPPASTFRGLVLQVCSTRPGFLQGLGELNSGPLRLWPVEPVPQSWGMVLSVVIEEQGTEQGTGGMHRRVCHAANAPRRLTCPM